MGYDRVVDYQRRSPRNNPISTYEIISSNESSDGEVQVIDEAASASIPEASTSNTTTTVIAPTHPEHTTEVVVETSSAHEQSCTFNDVNVNTTEIAENVPPASSEVVVESSDSECQFVLALKPPHLRTPEQVSLDSASDSDCVFVPNTSPKVKEISSEDSESDNIPLSETQLALKQETTDTKPIVYNNEPIPASFVTVDINPSSNSHSIDNLLGPSTSSSSGTSMKSLLSDRKRLAATKSIFTESSSSSSSDSSSDDYWQSNTKRRRKRKKTNPKQLKPLSELPSSEGAHNNDNDDKDEDEIMHENPPRIRSVIIRKNDNDQLYIDNNAPPNNDDTSHSDQTSE